MKARIEDLILIQDRAHAQPEDQVLYVRLVQGVGRVFTTNPGPVPFPWQATRAMRYGVYYLSREGDICVIPDQWNRADAACARLAITHQRSRSQR